MAWETDSPEYQDWLNDLMEHAPESYDDDVAMEAIVTRYVHDLEATVRQLAEALQGHRADMHNPSDRPCATCRASADALRAVGVEPYVEYVGMNRTAAMEAAKRAVPGGFDLGDWEDPRDRAATW